MDKQTKYFNIAIDLETHKKVKLEAIRRGITITNLVNEFVKSSLVSEPTEVPQRVIEKNKAEEAVTPNGIIVHKEIQKAVKPTNAKLCKHGYALNLCKKGCK